MEALRWAFCESYASNWHPLTWLSHMLDCELYGLQPGGHHLTNVALHATNVVLLFLLLETMTGCCGRSAVVALVFALHPLNVQSVAWVSERKNVLSTLFWMLTLLAYVRYARQPRWWTYLPVVVGLALGLMAKSMLVTLPFVLLLLDYWPLERVAPLASGLRHDGGIRPIPVLRLVAEKTPLFFLSFASSVVTFWAQRHGGAVTPLDATPMGLRISNAVESYSEYLRKMICPTDLVFFYPYPTSIPAWSVAASGLFLLVVSALSILSYRRYPFLTVGWLWYLGTLVPVIGIVQVGIAAMADRYAYVPLIGVFIMLCWAGACLCEVWRINKWAAPLATLAVILACMVTTRRELGFWKDSETLFRRAIAVAKDTSAAHNDLGTVLTEQHRYDEAIYHFREALRIDPDHALEHRNLGVIFAKQGQFEEAGVQFAQALRIEPGDPEVLKNLIAVLKLSGTLEEGKWQYKEALSGQPDKARAARDIAWVLATHEQASVRDGVEAVRLARRAVELTGSREPAMLDALAAAYAEAGRFAEAASTAESAMKLAAAAGNTELVAELRSRHELYSQGLPYREATKPVPR